MTRRFSVEIDRRSAHALYTIRASWKIAAAIVWCLNSRSVTKRELFWGKWQLLLTYRFCVEIDRRSAHALYTTCVHTAQWSHDSRDKDGSDPFVRLRPFDTIFPPRQARGESFISQGNDRIKQIVGPNYLLVLRLFWLHHILCVLSCFLKSSNVSFTYGLFWIWRFREVVVDNIFDSRARIL